MTIKLAIYILNQLWFMQKFVGNHHFCTHKSPSVIHSEATTVCWYQLGEEKKKDISFPLLIRRCLLEELGLHTCNSNSFLDFC